MLPITAFYAALLAVLFLLLSAGVIGSRQTGAETGQDAEGELLRRLRAHASFIEYVPFTLLLMALAESLTTPVLLMHIIGLLLLAGRLLHAYGASHAPPIVRYQSNGTILTLAALAISAIVCLALSAFLLAI
jgi:uncharacterized membrane protein YecN with MAPEG domain